MTEIVIKRTAKLILTIRGMLSALILTKDLVWGKRLSKGVTIDIQSAYFSWIFFYLSILLRGGHISVQTKFTDQTELKLSMWGEGICGSTTTNPLSQPLYWSQ